MMFHSNNLHYILDESSEAKKMEEKFKKTTKSNSSFGLKAK